MGRGSRCRWVNSCTYNHDERGRAGSSARRRRRRLEVCVMRRGEWIDRDHLPHVFRSALASTRFTNSTCA